MVTGVIQVISMLSAVWVDGRSKQTIFAMMASVLPTIAGVIVLLTVPFEHSKRIGLLFAYYIITAYWGCAGLALSLVTRNIAGQTKKSVVIAVNFVFWAVGNAIGPQTYRSNQAPRYFVAISVVLGCFVLLEVVLLSLRTYYIYQNKKRDKLVERGEVVADTTYTHSFEDVTDRVSFSFQCNFRCVYFRLLIELLAKRAFPVHLLSHRDSILRNGAPTTRILSL